MAAVFLVSVSLLYSLYSGPSFIFPGEYSHSLSYVDIQDFSVLATSVCSVFATMYSASSLILIVFRYFA